MDLTNIQNAIKSILKNHFYSTPESLADSAKELSDRFTKFRDDVSKDYLDDPKTRAAYIAHFTLTNIVKACHCLNQIPDIFSTEPIKILDVGCGSGACSLAASQLFKDAHLEIFGVDKSGAILKDAYSIFNSCCSTKHSFNVIESEVHARSLARTIGGERFDIMLIANLLNELKDSGEDFRLCKDLLEEHLNDEGYIIIIDTALRETTRPLMVLRDLLIEKCEAHVVAPCLHQQSCPMLKQNERDWCHFYIEWERPPLIERMDSFVGTDHTYLKMGYLILQKCGKNAVTTSRSRIVSSPLISKGKREIMACHGSGDLLKLKRLDRNKSETNSRFDLVKRGDIVECAKQEKIEKTSNFEIIKQWNNF